MKQLKQLINATEDSILFYGLFLLAYDEFINHCKWLLKIEHCTTESIINGTPQFISAEEEQKYIIKVRGSGERRKDRDIQIVDSIINENLLETNDAMIFEKIYIKRNDIAHEINTLINMPVSEDFLYYTRALLDLRRALHKNEALLIDDIDNSTGTVFDDYLDILFKKHIGA